MHTGEIVFLAAGIFFCLLLITGVIVQRRPFRFWGRPAETAEAVILHAAVRNNGLDPMDKLVRITLQTRDGARGTYDEETHYGEYDATVNLAGPDPAGRKLTIRFQRDPIFPLQIKILNVLRSDEVAKSGAVPVVA